MKILFVMPAHISYGGIESTALNMWRGLTKRGHHIDFVCHGSQKGIFENEIKTTGSRVFHIPLKSQNFRKMKAVFRYILKTGSYEAVHAHMNATSGIYLQMAKEYGVSVLAAHSHASSMRVVTGNPFKAVINHFEKYRTNQLANVKIACSDKAGRWLYGRNPHTVIFNAVDVNLYSYSPYIREMKRKSLGITQDEWVGIHVGSFTKNKNQSFLIQVLHELENRKIKMHLLMAGKGPTFHKISHLIQKNGLESRITLLGERNDINELLQAADVFFLPSVSEGNPVSLMEAAASGLHCLVSETVSNSLAPYFEPGMIEYLPIKLENAALIWAKSAIKPYKRVEFTRDSQFVFTIEHMSKQIEDLYLAVFNN